MRRPFGVVVQIALLATLTVCGVGFSRPARGEVTLSVAKDRVYGIAIFGNTQVKGTTETNPIRLDYGTTQARLRQNGSDIRLLFSFGSDSPGDTHSARTFRGDGVPSDDYTGLNIVIGGTNGEAIGTPVLLSLHSTFIGNRFDAINVAHSLDGTNYDLSTDVTFTHFKVGDTFSYLAYVDVGANMILQSTLSVAPARVAAEPVAAPEPSSLLLLGAVLAGGVSFARRKIGVRVGGQAAALLALFGGGVAVSHAQTTPGRVREIPLAWPHTKSAMPGMALMPGMGSTHEIAWNRKPGTDGGEVWVSGQNYDAIARITTDGTVTYFPLPKGSGPHGLVFDRDGRLWVTLEFSGKVARVDANGKIAETIDVCLHTHGATAPINTHPHGLAVGPDGKTLWFTGKKTGTVGRITPEGTVTHIDLPTVGSVPIYITPGPEGAMWCTELVGNKIARITPDGAVTEFDIPTPNSRPITLVLAPDKQSLWFSEEAGSSVARIDPRGVITEFPLPRPRRGSLLGGLCFDPSGRLWVECYDVDVDSDTGQTIRTVSVEGGGARGGVASDYLVCFDTLPGVSSGVAVTYHPLPSRLSILHRVIPGPGGALWFTEMGGDHVGVLKGDAR